MRPATTKNLAMGLGLGIVIGLVLISLAEALDTRIRRSDEVSERLGLPLLTRIPIPPRSLRKTGSLGMLDDEGGLQSEAYRKLRINLDFANLSIKARTIMITSAAEQEGKSTTVANLAIALARAGRRVVLVDLDLRKPFIDHFFDLTGRPGLTDVALGNVTLDQALWSIPFPGSDAGPQSGSLYVLPSGPMPPNPADLIESSVVTEVLLDLAERADVVLLDSAPLLPVSDGVVLSNKVDAMLVVVRGLDDQAADALGAPARPRGLPVREAWLRPHRRRGGRGLRIRLWLRGLRDLRPGAARAPAGGTASAAERRRGRPAPPALHQVSLEPASSSSWPSPFRISQCPVSG